MTAGLKKVSIRNPDTIYHSKWFLGHNHITTNSSAIITLTSALLFFKSPNFIRTKKNIFE